jgi:hypothetical protein
MEGVAAAEVAAGQPTVVLAEKYSAWQLRLDALVAKEPQVDLQKPRPEPFFLLEKQTQAHASRCEQPLHALRALCTDLGRRVEGCSCLDLACRCSCVSCLEAKLTEHLSALDCTCNQVAYSAIPDGAEIRMAVQEVADVVAVVPNREEAAIVISKSIFGKLYDVPSRLHITAYTAALLVGRQTQTLDPRRRWRGSSGLLSLHEKGMGT